MQPIYRFPGDNAQDYAVMDKPCRYPPYTVPATAAAAEALGIAVTARFWETLLRGYRYAFMLDDLLDSPDGRDLEAVARAHDVYRRLVRGDDPSPAMFPGVDPDLLAVARLCNNAWVSLDRAPFIMAADKIAAYALRKAKCRNVWPYAFMLYREGRACADLVSASMTLEEKTQPQARAFGTWWRDAMGFGTLSNSTYDLKDDREGWLTQVGPHRVNKGIMMVLTFISGLWLLRRPVVAYKVDNAAKQCARREALKQPSTCSQLPQLSPRGGDRDGPSPNRPPHSRNLACCQT